jgi:hypothetical protein
MRVDKLQREKRRTDGERDAEAERAARTANAAAQTPPAPPPYSATLVGSFNFFSLAPIC